MDDGPMAVDGIELHPPGVRASRDREELVQLPHVDGEEELLVAAAQLQVVVETLFGAPALRLGLPVAVGRDEVTLLAQPWGAFLRLRLEAGNAVDHVPHLVVQQRLQGLQQAFLLGTDALIGQQQEPLLVVERFLECNRVLFDCVFNT